MRVENEFHLRDGRTVVVGQVTGAEDLVRPSTCELLRTVLGDG